MAVLHLPRDRHPAPPSAARTAQRAQLAYLGLLLAIIASVVAVATTMPSRTRIGFVPSPAPPEATPSTGTSVDRAVVAADVTDGPLAGTGETGQIGETDQIGETSQIGETRLWPPPSSSRLFDDPRSAAEAMARELLGFDRPVVAGLRGIGADTGEVDIRPTTDGPTTVVEVVRSGAGWAVRAARSEEITIEQPAPGATVAGAVAYLGTASSPDGFVELRVHVDGQRVPLATTSIATGLSSTRLAIEGVLGWWEPATGWGALVTVSRDDGGAVWAATAVPIQLAP